MGISTVGSPQLASSVNSLVANLGITIIFKTRFVANQAAELENSTDDNCKNKIPAIIIFRCGPIKRAFFYHLGINFDQKARKLIKKRGNSPVFGAFPSSCAL